MLSRQRRRKIRNWAIGFLGPPLVRMWAGSLRLRILTDIEKAKRRVVIPDCIVLVWHQRLFTLAGSCPNSGFRALISRHADGEMLARVLEGIGVRPVRGSSTRGGVQAIRELLDTDERPVRIAITPDGPRGPPFVLQQGAIYVASKTGLPIYTVTVGIARSWRLRTWDQFLLPKPFSRAILRTGPPYHVPPDLDRAGIETWRQKIETDMRQLTEDTDVRFEEIWRQGTRFGGFAN